MIAQFILLFTETLIRIIEFSREETIILKFFFPLENNKNKHNKDIIMLINYYRYDDLSISDVPLVTDIFNIVALQSIATFLTDKRRRKCLERE